MTFGDDPRLRRWLDAMLATPGLTAITDPGEAYRLHVTDALTALSLLEDGPVVDVGSGGGSPGIPIALARPDLDVTLLEATERKCAFLRSVAGDLPNVHVVCARAEDYARAEGRDRFAAALARALAPPPVAAEWCLPLVRPGGIAVLYVGHIDVGPLALVAGALNAAPPDVLRTGAEPLRQLVVFRKLGPTPERFPRRTGAARKRPLG